MDSIFNAEVINILGNFLLGIGVVAVFWAMSRSVEKDDYDVYYDDRYYTDYTVDYDR